MKTKKILMTALIGAMVVVNNQPAKNIIALQQDKKENVQVVDTNINTYSWTLPHVKGSNQELLNTYAYRACKTSSSKSGRIVARRAYKPS